MAKLPRKKQRRDCPCSDAHRGGKIKCPLSETRDTVEIARDSGARTSCAGCDDEAVYTMGWYNEGWNDVSSRGIRTQGRGIVSTR